MFIIFYLISLHWVPTMMGNGLTRTNGLNACYSAQIRFWKFTQEGPIEGSQTLVLQPEPSPKIDVFRAKFIPITQTNLSMMWPCEHVPFLSRQVFKVGGRGIWNYFVKNKTKENVRMRIEGMEICQSCQQILPHFNITLHWLLHDWSMQCNL